MKIKSITPKSIKFLQSLKPKNPNSQSSFIHISNEKPSTHSQSKLQSLNNNNSSSSLSSSSIIHILNSTDKESWNSNSQLTLAFISLSPLDVLQITRKLGNYSVALHFVEHLRSIPEIKDADSISFAFQGVSEHASCEMQCGIKVLEIYEKAVEWNVSLSVDSVNHLIRSLSRAKMVDKLMMIYAELKSQLKNVDVCNVVIDELLKHCRLGNALQVLDEMLEPNSEVFPNESTMEIVFAAVLHGKKHGKWVGEDELVDMVTRFAKRGLFPNSNRLTKWISSLCRFKKTYVAWEVLHAIMELGGPVDAPSCNALLTGLNKSREFDKMNLLVKEMQNNGIRPDVATLGIRINNLCKAMRVDEALCLFEKIRKGEISADIKPDTIIYNTIIDGLCKCGRVEEGLAMVRKMRSECEWTPNTVTFNCLIDGFSKEGDMDKALELFYEMEQEGVVHNIITVNILIKWLCRHGRAGGALKLYREMQEKGFDGNAKTYTTLISSFCGVNNIQKARELLEEMKRKCKPDVIVYNTLISGLSRAGLMHEVESILSEMKSAGFCPDVDCYNVMINGYCKKKKLDKAHQLLKDMDTDGLTPDSVTYNTLISHFSKIGDLQTLHKLLDQMINSKIVPTVVTYGVIINAYCSVGKLDEAMNIFSKIKKFARIPPNTVIYNTLIDHHCRIRKIEKAMSLFDEMLGKDVKPTTNTFNALFKVCHAENRVEEALELMDKMTELGVCPDYITLEELTKWLPSVGESEKLRRFVEEHTSSSSSSVES